MTWYYQPGAQGQLRIWPPNVDLLQLNAMAAGSYGTQAAAIRAEVRPPNMFEWSGSTAGQHVTDLKSAQGQIDIAIRHLQALEKTMNSAIVEAQAVVMQDEARLRAAGLVT